MKRRLPALVLGFVLASAVPAAGSAATTDWMTGLPRTTVAIPSWPNGKKVAICFILDVEHWGLYHGPNFRPDTASRNPDYLNESFREYAIHWGVPRVARVFAAEGVPLSVALNAVFPQNYPDTWQTLRSIVPKAPIVAHGMNNSTELLPLNGTLADQEAYVRKTLDTIQQSTGVRPKGWQSPNVEANAQTFTATAAQGITYTLDAMDSDVLSSLQTNAGPLLELPYPTVPVDMGQFFQRSVNASEVADLWMDYARTLDGEAQADPSRPAVAVVIGVHPFVMGTPDGAAAMHRTLQTLKALPTVWLADTDAVAAYAASGGRR